MAVDTAAKRWSAMGFGSIGGWIPLPDGDIAAADRATLLALYGGLLLSDTPPPIGKGHRKKPRLTPEALDFDRVRQQWLNRVEAKEKAMLTSRLQQELANRKVLVRSLLASGNERRIQMQLTRLDERIAMLQREIAKLRAEKELLQ